MKNTCIIACLMLLPLGMRAQTLSASLGIGTGIPYWLQSRAANGANPYQIPFSSRMEVAFHPEEGPFGLVLRFQQFEVDHYETNGPVLTVSHLEATTTSLLLERKHRFVAWELGYNFGIGYVNESYDQDFFELTNRMVGYTASGFARLSLSSRLSMDVQPTFTWQGPIRGNIHRESQIGGRDLGAFVHLGIVYLIVGKHEF
ncbi:hypothetical protein [Pontibacter sp. G13]|uniref:hypothetical protein n=1 Tax=Pontibacter sp. G13 TaxID=3074898 RepID=UPI00288AF226|nr:hypothetical protein [Pontibacter sp. G13]WNJ20111.1 hypothetical protein RJD25_06465 [Pontibacter sp. G13]